MKKIAIVATTAALTLSLGAFAGCAPKTVGNVNESKPAAQEISTETVTTQTDDGKELVMYAAVERPVSHAGEAYDDCTACHTNGSSQIPAMPADHEGRTGDMCAMCHTEGGAAVAVPADHEGRTEDTCASCHTTDGVTIVAIPEDHYVNDSYSSGKINDMHENCLACHGIDEEAVAAAKEAAEKAAAEAAAAEAAAAEAEKDAADAEGDAPAEVDAPDCAPCHGDAHKPGEENPHGYPTAAAASDDKAAADDKAADDKASTAKADDKADTKSSSSSSSSKSDSKSSTSSSSSSSSKSSSSSSSDKAASDAPDCSACHGDAHKPGDENPHGY